MKNNKGAITVFMALVFAVMFLFAGLLIDSSRILLARYTVRVASESATRSLMAKYDENLMADYGLYAIQKNDTENLKTYKKYLNSNLGISNANEPEKKPYFSIIKFDSDSLKEASVDLEAPIYRDDVFKKQITEYEKGRKYAFVIQEGIEILKDLITDSKLDEMKKAKTSLDSQTDVKQKASIFDNQKGRVSNDIKSKMNSAKISLPNYYDNELKITRMVDSVFSANDASLENITKSTAKSLFKNALSTSRERLKANLNNANMDDCVDVLSQLEQNISDLETSLNKASADINEAERVNDTSEADERIAPNDYVKNAEGIDIEGLRARISNSRQSIQTCREKIENVKNKLPLYKNDYKVLADIYSYACLAFCVCNEYKIRDGYENETAKSEMASLVNECINQEKNNLKTLSISSLTATSQNVSDGTLIIEIKSMYSNLVSEQNRMINEIESFEITPIGEVKIPEEKENPPENSEKEENEKKVNDGIEELEKNLKIYASNDLGQLFSGNNAGKRFSQPVSGFDTVSNVFASIPFLQLIPMIEDLVKTLSDNVNFDYNVSLTCYIMEKTNNITSAARKNHFFKYGETEYIKYGWDKQWANILSSVTSMISFRFSINSVYYFIKTPGGPIARLISGAALGAIQTAVDSVGLFVTGGGCKMIPFMRGPDFTYSDHLLIMTFFESAKKEKLLDTMQASLMQRDKTGKANLKEMYTTVKTHCAVDVDLIFMKLFGFELINWNEFNNGAYRVNVDLTMSY